MSTSENANGHEQGDSGEVRSDDLAALARAFKTDKEGEHFYAQHYQRAFQSRRLERLNILEIGIGGYDNPTEGGASLRMWKAYFPNSRIFGIDIHDKSYHDEDRIKTFQGSQVDEEFLLRVAAEIGRIDIIIDDGSHLNEHVITTFKILFPILSPDGMYVVEDVQTSYWESVEGQDWGGSKDLKAPHTSMNFFKGLVDGLNHEEYTIANYSPGYFDEHIVSMQFAHNLIFIQKGVNKEGSNVLAKVRAREAAQRAMNPVDTRTKWLNIEFSSICNLRCRWCILDHGKPKEYLSLETFENILRHIANGDLPDLERIDLHNGGEALLHPEIDRGLTLLAQYRKTFPRPIHISLLTNGTVLQESTLQLLASGGPVDEIRVSVDGGTPQEFERLRTNAKWAKVSANVRRIADALKAAHSRTTLGIICMVAPEKPLEPGWMDPEFRSVIQLATNLELRHPHTWEGSLEEIDGLKADTTQKRKDRVCMFLKRNLVVMANGDVTVCCADLNGRGVIGSVNGESLKEIAHGANRDKMLELWQEGRFDEIPICSTCQGHYDPEPELLVAQEEPHETTEREMEGMTLGGLLDLAKIEPKNSLIQNNIGVLLCQQGKHTKAVTHFKQAVTIDPRYVVALKNLGNVQEVLKKFGEAAYAYQCILNLEPDDVDALSGMGRLSMEAGRFDSAHYFFRRVVAVDPSNSGAKQIIDSLDQWEKQGLIPAINRAPEDVVAAPVQKKDLPPKQVDVPLAAEQKQALPEADAMVAEFQHVNAVMHSHSNKNGKSHQKHPANLEALKKRIQPLVDQGYYVKALKECVAELAHERSNPRLIALMARLYHRAGCKAEAEALFSRASSVANGDREVLRHAEMFAWATQHLPTSRTDIDNFCDPDLILVQAPGWGANTSPLGTATLTSYARSKGFKVLPVDLNVEFYLRRTREFEKTWELEQSLWFWNTKDSVERMLHVFRESIDAFVSMVIASNARVVGFTIYESSSHISLVLAKKLKQLKPSITVVFGGPQASRFAGGPAMIATGAVDAVAQGEGELTLVDLLERVRSGKTLIDCPGLLVRGENGMVDTGDREVITELDQVPPPDFSDYAFERYRTPNKLPVSSSRGCLNRCIFCNERPFWKKYRYRSADNVFAEIKAQMHRYPTVNFIEFQDSVVNGVIRELDRLADLIIASGIRFSWSAQAVIRKEMVPELMMKLKKSGCVCLAYGLETPSSGLMLKVGKVASRGADVDAIASAHAKTGLGVTYNFMFGLPGETEEDFFESLEFLRRNRKNNIAVNPSPSFCGFSPGTLAYENPEKYGLDLSKGAMYWESKDGENTYVRRLKRFEEFCRLVKELGISTTYPATVLLDRNRTLGNYYFQAGEFKRARWYYEAWLAEHPDDKEIRDSLEKVSHTDASCASDACAVEIDPHAARPVEIVIQPNPPAQYCSVIVPNDQSIGNVTAKPKGIICTRPFYEFEIDITGQVVVCCTAWLKHSLGNMKNQNIAEIWNGQVARHIRRKMYRGEWEDICNASCPTIVEYTKFGKTIPYDELEKDTNLTPQHIEEIRAGKVVLESTPTLFKLSDSKVCNLSCKMCGVVLSDALVDDRGMIQKRTDDLMKYLDKAKIILMCGNGDPFARKDTRELLMNYQGTNSDLQFALVTNGLLLPRFWDKVKHQKFESINISVDAPVPEVYEKIRNGGKWEDILKTLDLVKANRDKFKTIVISMVVMRSNYRLIPAFIDFVESYGFVPLFSRIHGQFDTENIFEMNDRAALTELRTILGSERQKKRSVDVVWQDLIEYAD
jgi:radical SAM superfamily enzyme YgiQ (UPF0313 family)/MoaA/NifB/PqqE/SkfB family radical SAM enzyme/Tfp pilus assembly protein PilF